MDDGALAVAVGCVTPREIVWNIVRKIDSTPLQTRPFDHIYLEDLFDPRKYREILNALPDTAAFHTLRHPDAMRADGSSTRLRLYLYPESLFRLPSEQRRLWTAIARALMSRELQDAYKRKFKTALESRFGCTIDRLKFYPVPILVRDQPGYRIGVHTDIPEKAITCQFYLPRDASQEHLGTLFHESKKSPGVENITAMKFQPASGYAFVVRREASWHSVSGTSESDRERVSLMLTYFVQDSLVLWLKCRLQRLRNVLGKPSAR